jgi:hypothetical protein
MSMYFQEHDVRKIIDGMMPILRRPDSLLWVDLVNRQAIEHPETIAKSVEYFMRGMQILGEPFTFGPDSVEEFMQSAGLRPLEVVTSDVCFSGKKDPVYSIYKFCVGTVQSTNDAKRAVAFQGARIDRKARAPAPSRLPESNPLRGLRLPANFGQPEARRNV